MILTNDHYVATKFSQGANFLSKSLFKPYQQFNVVDIMKNSWPKNNTLDSVKLFNINTARFTYYAEAISHSHRVDPSRKLYLYKSFFDNLINYFIINKNDIILEEIKAANALYDQNDIIDYDFYKIIYAQLNSQYKLIKIDIYQDEELEYYKELISSRIWKESLYHKNLSSLNLESAPEDLKEKALEFSKFIFNIANNTYYLRKFENQTTYQDLPIFHNFNKNIYSLFKDSIVRTSKTYIPYSSEYVQERLPLGSVTKKYIHNNKNLLGISDYPTDFSSITYDEIEPLLNQTQKAILIKSWVKKSDTPIELKEFKKSVFKNKKGYFLPLSFNFQYLDKDLTLKPALFFSLSLNENNSNKTIYSRINSSKVTRKAFSSLIECLFEYDGLYFLNQDEFFKRKIKEIEDLNLNICYSSNISESTKKYLDFLKEKREYINSNVIDDENYISEIVLKRFISTPKKDESLQRAISKIDNKLNLTLNLTKQNMCALNSVINENKKALIANLSKQVSEFYWERQSSSTPITFNPNILSLTNYFQQSIKKHNLLKIENENINQNLHANNLSYDEALLRMLKEIKVVDISYHPLEDINQTTKTSTPISLNKLSHESKSHNAKIKKIASIEYLIDKVLPVYINSKVSPTAIKAIGPLYVKVLSNKIFLKIKDNSTLFGVVDDINIKLHPHSNPKNYNYDDWHYCCLGEASSLLYKAFEKNDLKEILLSTLIWLTSGNSADTWGRHYISFPDYSDCTIQQNSTEEVNKKEVNDFLNLQVEEEIEFEAEQEPLEDLTSVQPPRHQDFEQTQTTNNYVRYL